MFSKKSIRVEVQKISGNYTPFSGTYSFSDLPIEVKINKVKMPAGYTANIDIYGITKSKMDSMTVLRWKTLNIDKIAVRVYVNDGKGEDLLFEGNVMSAAPNYNNAPDICISITACAGAWYNLMTDVPPSSFSDATVSAPILFNDICSKYGLKADVRGLNDKMTSLTYVDGNGLAVRLAKAAKALDVQYFIDNSVVRVWPKDNFRYEVGQPITLTSNDYIGYPSFNAAGIHLKLDRLLHPVQLGDFFIIKNSEVTAANDKWAICKIIYNISTRLGGKWQTEMDGVRVGILD